MGIFSILQKRNGVMRRINTILAFILLSTGFFAASAQPEMLGYKVWNVSGVEFDNGDFSGITASPDGSCFVTVFNSAGMYYMDIPADDDTELKVRPLHAYNAQFKDGKRDMEALTVKEDNGDIYFVQERSTYSKETAVVIYKGNTLYRLSAPDYAEVEIIETFGKEIVPNSNYAFEGLAWMGGDKFLLGREGDKKGEYPAAIYEYILGTGLTRVFDVSRWTRQVADICYDAEGGYLWITDSDYEKKLYMVKPDSYKPVAEYDISFIENAEGIYVDHERNCIWIASDEEPSKLYKLEFKGL